MSNVSTIRHFFNQIDLYGLTFPLHYKRHKAFNTLCGIILTLITIFGIFSVFLNFLVNVIDKKDMSIISNTEHLYTKKLFNFNNYPILIGYLKDGGPKKIDFSVLNITLDKNDHYPDKDEDGIINIRRESTSIKLEKCDINIHFNNTYIRELIKEVEYEKYLCPVPGQNLSIGGRWSDNIHGYDILEFHVIKCENTTKNKNCKSEEEMQPYFENAYLSIIYLAQSLDHYDVYNPIKEKFRYEIFSIVTSLVKRYYYYFLPGEYISDNGFIFNNISTFNFFEYDRLVADFVDNEDQSFYSSATLAEVCFSSVDKFITYERKYAKIQDYLGNIGGWIKIILVICQFINDYFSEKIFLVDFIISISPIQGKKRRFVEINKTKTTIHRVNNYLKGDNSSNCNIQNSPCSNKPIIKESKTENINLSSLPIANDKFFLKSQRKIQLNIFEYFIPLWLMKKKKKYYFFFYYKDFIYKDISLEVFVPLVERLLKLNFVREKNNKNEYFTRLSYSILNMKKKK